MCPSFRLSTVKGGGLNLAMLIDRAGDRNALAQRETSERREQRVQLDLVVGLLEGDGRG